MANKRSSEAIYAFDDPLQAATSPRSLSWMKELEKSDVDL
jgi:hypothetical protein